MPWQLATVDYITAIKFLPITTPLFIGMDIMPVGAITFESSSAGSLMRTVMIPGVELLTAVCTTNTACQAYLGLREIPYGSAQG